MTRDERPPDQSKPTDLAGGGHRQPPADRHVLFEAVEVCAGLLGVAAAAWLFPASVYILGWSPGGPSRVALFESSGRLAALVTGALFTAVVLLAASRRGGWNRQLAAIARPLSLLWLWVVPYLPWLPDRVPLLLVLAGPLRWAVALLAVLGALRAAIARWPPAAAWPIGRKTVFVCSLVLYAACGLRSAATIGPGGDEPHYLVIAHSLLADRDLQIENNHARGDYRAFYGAPLRPDYLRRGLNGQIYSIHAPGLPVALLPAYAASGYRGAVLTLALLAALAALAVYDVALTLTGPGPALITWAGVCLGVSFVPYAWLLYPEMAGALVVAWAVLWLARPIPDRLTTWMARGAALATLPWLHTKFAVLLIVLVPALLVRIARRPRAIAGVLAPLALSFGAWLLYFYLVYGTPNPEAPYGAYSRTYLGMENLPRGLLGILFDQKFGLLFYSPMYCFATVGGYLMLRRAGLRVLGAVLLLATLAFTGASLRLYMWWGGSSAPARFLVPILPCLAPMIALAVGQVRGAVGRALAGISLAMGLAVAVAGSAWPERLFFYSDPHGSGRLVQAVQGAAPLALSLPTFTEQDWQTPAFRLAAWLAASAIGVWAIQAGVRYGRMRCASASGLGLATFLAAAGVLAGRSDAEVRNETMRRNALTLLASYDGSSLRAFDYDSTSRLGDDRLFTLAALRFEGYPVGDVALPAGRYEARVWFAGARRSGAVTVASSRHRIAFGRLEGELSNPTTVPFELPVDSSRLTVNVADQAVAASVRAVELRPLAIVPRGARPRVSADVRSIEPLRERPGASLAYMDVNTYPEGGVFWTRDTRPGTVLLVPAGAAAATLTLFTGPVAGEVMLSVAGETTTVTVPAGEIVHVERSLPPGAPIVALTVQSRTAFQPSATSPGSADTRRLGCQVRVALR